MRPGPGTADIRTSLILDFHSLPRAGDEIPLITTTGGIVNLAPPSVTILGLPPEAVVDVRVEGTSIIADIITVPEPAANLAAVASILTLTFVRRVRTSRAA